MLGFIVKPDDASICMENVNPSFLRKKTNREHHLVTAFSDVGRYSKPQPTMMPDVNVQSTGRPTQEGIMTKLSDDLYCGANNPQQLLDN